MEVYEIEKIQSFKRLGVTVECMTAYGKKSFSFTVVVFFQLCANGEFIEVQWKIHIRQYLVSAVCTWSLFVVFLRQGKTWTK